MNLQDVKKRLQELEPKFNDGIQNCESEAAFKDWGIEIIKEIGSIVLPEDNISFRNKNQPPQELLEEQKEQNYEQQINLKLREHFKLVEEIKDAIQQKIQSSKMQLELFEKSLNGTNDQIKSKINQLKLNYNPSSKYNKFSDNLWQLMFYQEDQLVKNKEIQSKIVEKVEQVLKASIQSQLQFEYPIYLTTNFSDGDQLYRWPDSPSVYNPIVAVRYYGNLFQFELKNGQKSRLKTELPLKLVKLGDQELLNKGISNIIVYYHGTAFRGFELQNLNSRSFNEQGIQVKSNDQSQMFSSGFNPNTQRLIGIKSMIDRDGVHHHFQFMFATPFVV